MEMRGRGWFSNAADEVEVGNLAAPRWMHRAATAIRNMGTVGHLVLYVH